MAYGESTHVPDFGPPIALALKIPFVMIRKAGKLPGVLVSSGKYVTEYSTDETVMRLGSVKAGDRVVLAGGRRPFNSPHPTCTTSVLRLLTTGNNLSV